MPPGRTRLLGSAPERRAAARWCGALAAMQAAVPVLVPPFALAVAPAVAQSVAAGPNGVSGVAQRPEQGHGPCHTAAVPESRTTALDARLFDPGGVDLSANGLALLAGLARALDTARLEVVVVTALLPAQASTEMAPAVFQQRAAAVREQLARAGVPRERIYVEQRSAAAASAHGGGGAVVIEAIAAWPLDAAGGIGTRCLA